MKVTVKHIAFTLESMAHMNNDPRIKPYVGHLLLAANLVRKCTDNQLAEALEELVVSHSCKSKTEVGKHENITAN